MNDRPATTDTAFADPAAVIEPEPPAGFSAHTRHSPLTAPWEPIFACADGLALRLGVWLRQAHCNGRGLAHGGLIAALADNAMGLTAVAGARDAAPQVAGAVTTGLALDYLDSARPGEWLEVRPRLLKAGRTLAVVEAHVVARAATGGDERLVARANATFRLG